MQHVKNIFFTAVYIIIASTVLIINPFSGLNNMLCDMLCTHPIKAQADIFVIGIDDKSLQELGPFQSWPRSYMAEIIELLNKDESTRPAVIGIDVMYFGKTEYDKPLFLASDRHDNLVFTSELKFADTFQKRKAGIYSSDLLAYDVELPQSPISETSQHGFANVIRDTDGIVRRYLTKQEVNGVTYHNFAVEIYRMYQKHNNLPAAELPVDSNNLLTIAYCAKPGIYGQGLSFCDVLSEKIPTALFKDSIVLIGSYASGMMDSYNTPIDYGASMYGVEINANMIQALCEQRYMKEVPLSFQLLLTLTILILCIFLYQKQAFIKNLTLLFTTAGYLGAVYILSSAGYILIPLYIPLFSAVLYLYRIIADYMEEHKKRLQTLETFKRYVSPEIANLLLKDGSRAMTEMTTDKRHIAVLFVDIRGFTPLSEKMQPEEIAGVLNEYLSLTSSCIFKNGGTVDKFIGDATMALFNAPSDLENYIYKSVRTALDIVSGSQELNDKIHKKYGITVQFGIGIHCGDVVVGSIGAPFRMDYTAIGDTVNTAARLESNAAPGQILVSKEICQALSPWIEVTFTGSRQLKGKSQPVELYQVDFLKNL